jgi:hypothetical protein
VRCESGHPIGRQEGIDSDERGNESRLRGHPENGSGVASVGLFIIRLLILLRLLRHVRFAEDGYLAPDYFVAALDRGLVEEEESAFRWNYG